MISPHNLLVGRGVESKIKPLYTSTKDFNFNHFNHMFILIIEKDDMPFVFHRACADPGNFVRGRPTLTTILFPLKRGGRIQIPL